MRAGTALEPVIYGGGQERGLRAGTENVALIAALGTAAELAARDLARGEEVRLEALRDRLHSRLMVALPDMVELNGPPAGRLPTTLNLSLIGIRGDELLAETPGVSASTGVGLPQRSAFTLAGSAGDGNGPCPGFGRSPVVHRPLDHHGRH